MDACFLKIIKGKVLIKEYISFGGEKVKEIVSTKQKCILFFVAIIFLSICSLIFFSLENVSAKSNKKNTTTEKEKEVYVDIKGEVNNPGVYKVNENNRINDVINASGGLTKNGSTLNINLSKKVEDEMVIIVSKASEIKTDLRKTDFSCNTDEIYLNSCLSSSTKVSTIVPNNPTETSNDNDNKNNIININTATKEELVTLSGIGESKAEAIIKYREENGNYKNIEDIKNVSGIGDALFAKIKDNITV